MRNKAYLSIGSVAMGIAGSMTNEDFFEDYLGMRNEYVDMTEIVRRWDEGIYDHDEFEKAYEWAKNILQLVLMFIIMIIQINSQTNKKLSN